MIVVPLIPNNQKVKQINERFMRPGIKMLLLTAAILTGCNFADKPQKFEDTKQLRATAIPEIEILSKGNVYLAVLDTFLIVGKSNAPFIEVFSTKSHRKVFDLGEEGEGPREFLGPTLIETQQGGFFSKSSFFFVHDFKKNQISRIDLQNVEENFKVRNIPKMESYLPFIHYAGSDHLIGTPEAGGHVSIFSLSEGSYKSIPYLPELSIDIPKQALSDLYRPAVTVHEKSRKMAVAPIYLGELDIFNFNGELLSRSMYSDVNQHKDEIEKGTAYLSELTQGIIELESTDDLIYGLNTKTPVKLLNGYKRYSTIQVFDWNGNPLTEYELEGTGIISFALDPLNNRLYTYDEALDSINISYYQFESEAD